jgi:hypothetical protein
VKFAALLFSEMSIGLYGRNQVESRYLDHFYGFYKVLSQSHIPFDVVQDEALTSNKELAGYKVLVLPNSVCLSQREVDAVSEFVRGGGGIVATFRSSLFDEKGRQRSNLALADVFGVDYLGSVTSPVFGYAKLRGEHEITQPLEGGNIIAWVDENLNVKTKGKTRSLCNLIKEPQSPFSPLGSETSLPVITVTDYGAGRAVYFPGKPDSLFLLYGLEACKTLLERSVLWSSKAELPFSFKNLISTVEVQAYIQKEKNRMIIHFINYTSEVPRPINEVIPASNVECLIKVPDDKKARDIKQLISGGNLSPTQVEKNRIGFTVPRINEHEIICVSYG